MIQAHGILSFRINLSEMKIERVFFLYLCVTREEVVIYIIVSQSIDNSI